MKFTATKKVISIKITQDETGDVILTVTALGFLTATFNLTDFIQSLTKK